MKKSHQRSSSVQSSSQEGQLIVLVGPTAVGKSALAMHIARRIGAEIICADSVTAYHEVTIGSAKPSRADRELVRHHLLDMCPPTHRLTVVEFVRAAHEAMADIWSRGKTILIVGGSGLYIDALLYGYTFTDDAGASGYEEEDLVDLSLDKLQELADQHHPGVLNDADRSNRRRLTQLLKRGLPASDDRAERLYGAVIIGLDKDDDVLKSTINKRTRQMLRDGLVAEVEGIRKKYGRDCACLQSVGYRQVSTYLDDGSTDEGELVEAINRATWRLVRKQRTWFRRSDDIHWFDTPEAALTLLHKNGYNV